MEAVHYTVKAITTCQLAGEYGAGDTLTGNLVAVSAPVSSVTRCVFMAALKTPALL